MKEMLNNISIGNVLNALVPISRFNKGEANKIFDEVNSNGFKIVVKNNKPTCILLTPEKYEDMMETIENYSLFFEAEKRMKTAGASNYISHEDMLEELKIDRAELDSVEVEIE